MATKNYADRLGPTNAGESRGAPTHASAPGPETYHAGKLNKGWPEVAPRVGIDGRPLETSGYGRNQAALPSSVGVEQAGGYDGGGLVDAPLHNPDPVLARLAGGVSHEANVADLSRKVGPNVGDAHGAGSARARQSGGVSKLSGSLPSKLGATQGEPVRQPPSGNTLKL